MSYILETDYGTLSKNGLYPYEDDNILNVYVCDTKQEARKVGAKYVLDNYRDLRREEKSALEQLAKTGSDSDFEKVVDANPHAEDAFYWTLFDTTDVIDVTNDGVVFMGDLIVDISDPNFDEKVDKVLKHFNLE